MSSVLLPGSLAALPCSASLPGWGLPPARAAHWRAASLPAVSAPRLAVSAERSLDERALLTPAWQHPRFVDCCDPRLSYLIASRPRCAPHHDDPAPKMSRTETCS